MTSRLNALFNKETGGIQRPSEDSPIKRGSFEDQGVEIDHVAEKKLVRKLDTNIIPVGFTRPVSFTICIDCSVGYHAVISSFFLRQVCYIYKGF